jgi:hypothetical protein
MEGVTMPRVLTSEEIEMLLPHIKTAAAMGKSLPQFTDTDGVLFDKLENRFLRYPAAKKDTSYTILSGVTVIADKAFFGCKGLTTLNIPESVTSIGGHFWGCKNLNHITVEKQNPRFSDIDNVLFDKIKNRILFSSYKMKEV